MCVAYVWWFILFLLYCLISSSCTSYRSTHDKLNKSQVLWVYTGFTNHSSVYMLVHFTKVAYINVFGKWKIIDLIILIHPPLLVLFPTIGISAGPSKEAWLLEGRSFKMNNHEGMWSIRPPIFNGSNLVYWKIRTRAYLQLLGDDVWEIVEGGYQFLAVIAIDSAGKKLYKTNAKVVNMLLRSLSKLEFVKSHAD